MPEISSTPIANTNRLCAIVIAYQPDVGFVDRLIKIQRSCNNVIVVDNTSAKDLDININSRLTELSRHLPICLIKNQNNVGIGAALNQGIQLATEKGYRQIVTFDQDSVVSESLATHLCKIALDMDPAYDIIGCNYLNAHDGELRYRCRNPHAGANQCTTVISSGMLISVDLINRIGSFREDYFIDSVDHEFCLRARSAGGRVWHSCKPLMKHAIGRTKDNRLGHTIVCRKLAFNHPPLRKYYMARNTVVTISHYWRHEPLWVAKQVLRLFAEICSIVLLENQKRHKLNASWLGIKHAADRTMGPLDSAISRRLDSG